LLVYSVVILEYCIVKLVELEVLVYTKNLAKGVVAVEK
jgi:hypothetical protein